MNYPAASCEVSRQECKEVLPDASIEEFFD